MLYPARELSREDYMKLNKPFRFTCNRIKL